MLTTQQLAAINWAETYWHENKKFPSVEIFNRSFPDIDFEEFMQNLTVRTAFHNRGMNNPNPSHLTDEQAAAILTVANYSDKRSLTAKLRRSEEHTSELQSR